MTATNPEDDGLMVLSEEGVCASLEDEALSVIVWEVVGMFIIVMFNDVV